MTVLREAVRDIVKRANAYARISGRARGGVSKLIFDDNRTLAILASGKFNVRLDRIMRGEARLLDLEGRTDRTRAGQRKTTRGKRKA